MKKNIALIFAGGTGQRLGKEIPKQFIEIKEKPIIIHTLEWFQNNNNIDEIYIVCIKDRIDYCWEIVKKFNINKVVKIIPGGQTGQESIYNGLVSINEENDGNSIVLIHDGVRPIINNRVIDDAINYTEKYGCAIPCLNCTETFVISDDFVNISDIPIRDSSYIAQAPQSFILKDILDAHYEIKKKNPNYENVIDSCTLYHMLGKKIYIFNGVDGNIKITTQKDLFLLKALIDYNNQLKIKEEQR